jgi:hypothetical protein
MDDEEPEGSVELEEAGSWGSFFGKTEPTASEPRLMTPALVPLRAIGFGALHSWIPQRKINMYI